MSLVPRLALIAFTISASIGMSVQPSPATTLRTVSIFPALPTEPTTNLKCPASLSVTALAVGPPGSAVSYKIFSVFNGQTTTIVPATSFNLPTSDGVANRTLTVPIPYNTASGNYIELDVTPSGGATQTSRLPVSCALNSDLAIPGGLTSATDSSQCVAHMIEDSQIAECDSAFPNHHLVLTWTYDQNGCIDKPCVSPDGYNIYKSVRKGPYALSKVQDHEPGQTAIVFGESHEEAGGSCFKVQAYKGKSDLGEAGAPFCIVPDPVTINASNIVETHSNNPRDEGPLNSLSCPASGGNPLGQKLWTTQSPYHQFDIGLIEQDNSCSSVDSIHGAAVQFDVTHLLPDPIRSAVFQMHVTSTAQNAGTTDSSSNGSEIATANSCAASVGTPSGWKPGDSVPGNIPFNKVASLPNPGSDGFVRVDVTNVVRNWYASSSSNSGLVLSWIFASWNGYIVSNANLNTYRLDRECLTSYDAASLKITYEW